MHRRALLQALVVALSLLPGKRSFARVESIQRLLEQIDSDFRATAASTGLAAPSAAVRRALERVPRDRFVDENFASRAWDNRPLPIGHGQTISQPFIVALMTELLRPTRDHIVLEVGTGSGYQAAILAECVAKVYSIEIVPELAQRARKVLDALGYRNIETRTGDGYAGWLDAAPFDGIIVTAAPDHVPPKLIEQLKPGARMVIPVGSSANDQRLLVVQKDATGHAITQQTLDVRFVPLTRSR